MVSITIKMHILRVTLINFEFQLFKLQFIRIDFDHHAQQILYYSFIKKLWAIFFS